jgi:hypothetical protein
MIKVFISHKSTNRAAAEALVNALSIVLARDDIFLAEEITKANPWREEIERALGEALCFILLYTDPGLDWSWCFYETGYFHSTNAPKRPIFCLHAEEVAPPGPLANLQTIKAAAEDLEDWIRNALCEVLGCRQPDGNSLSEAVLKIESLLKDASPIVETTLKPYIVIEPPLPVGCSNWNDTNAFPEINFAASQVSVDLNSAIRLGFGDPPKNMKLLAFLREIASDSGEKSDKLEFWINKVFLSLREAVNGRSDFQEAAFRHESGKIIRPIVVGFAKNCSGTICRLRITFESSFDSPLTDNPTAVQRLAGGVRLGVRTQLEIIDPFMGRMSEVYREKILGGHPQDSIGRRNPVGQRLISALGAIWQEAIAHGVRSSDEAPKLFEGSNQNTYEDIRSRALATETGLVSAATKEDAENTGMYPESERLLVELKTSNDAFLRLALPRLGELLTSGEGSAGPPVSESNPDNTPTIGF